MDDITLPKGIDPESVPNKKVLKVKVPTQMHMSLHTLKILSDQNISETVEEALRRYFDDLDMDVDEAAG